MSLGEIQHLAQTWSAGAASITSELNQAFDRLGFTEAYVDDCAQRMRAGRLNEGWVIKDNIWGMVSVDQQAARLFDSPLLQRLRWIHQLGFSYLVYPSAEHSRFPHSLGVYHVVTRFLDSIDHLQAEAAVGHGPRLSPHLTVQSPTQTERLDLTHAAILHDIGHLPFSHATEKILHAEKTVFTLGGRSVDEFLFDAEDALKKTVSLSECIALAVVLSKRFERFYTSCVRPGEPEAPARVAALIAGFRTNDANRALPDVISSGLDADKIDYLWRDAEACKISLGIDVARVFLRSMFIKVPADQIPSSLQSNKDPPGSPLTVFVVNASGIDTIEEITFARASMYQRVYQHQVTRSAERLLARALSDCLAASKDGSSKLVDALHLWTSSDSSLLSQMEHCGSNDGAIGRRLRNRQLPKRAAAFGQKLVEPIVNPNALLSFVQPDHVDSLFKQLTGAVVDQLKEDKLCGEALAKLESSITDEAVRIRDLVSSRIDGTPSGRPPLVTVLSLPNLGHTKVSECFVLERDGHLSSSREYSTSKELADAAEISKGLGHVYADDPWREFVFLALRTVLYDYPPAQRGLLPMDLLVDAKAEPTVAHVSCLPRFRLDLERTCRRSKVSLQQVERIHSALASTAYFDKKPALAPRWRHPKEFLDKVQPLTQFNGQHGWAVTDESILGFVNQFRPALRDRVGELLQSVTIIDRKEIGTLLKKSLEETSPSTSAPNYLAPLSPNSGQFLRMIFEQESHAYLQERGWTVCKTVQEALGRIQPGELLVLCDDNASSGSQAECQLRAWCGEDRGSWPEELQGEVGIEDRAFHPMTLRGFAKCDSQLAFVPRTLRRTRGSQRLLRNWT